MLETVCWEQLAVDSGRDRRPLDNLDHGLPDQHSGKPSILNMGMHAHSRGRKQGNRATLLQAAALRAAILNTAWAELPTENGEPNSGRRFRREQSLGFCSGNQSWKPLLELCGMAPTCIGEHALGTTAFTN